MLRFISAKRLGFNIFGIYVVVKFQAARLSLLMTNIFLSSNFFAGDFRSNSSRLYRSHSINCYSSREINRSYCFRSYSSFWF